MDITIIANDIVHVTRGAIAVLLAVEEQRSSPHTRDTTQGTETRGTTTDNDDIVVCLGDGLSCHKGP